MENLPAQFSRQTIRLQFPKDVHWGDDITVWISKVGDLAHSMYLRVTWPTDASTTVQPSAGTAMIDRIELSYKDQLIERIYGENLYMLGDIKVPQAKQSALSNLVGTGTTTALSSYHIPLPFLILKKGIPLIALKEAPKFRVVFNPSSIFTLPTSINTNVPSITTLISIDGTTGTISPTPIFNNVSRVSDYYLFVRSSSSYMDFGSQQINFGTKGFSAVCWVWLNSYNYEQRIFDFNYGFNTNDMVLSISSTLNFSYRETGGVQNTAYTGPINLNTLYKIGIVYDPNVGSTGQVQIWLNGSVVVTNTSMAYKGTDRFVNLSYVGKANISDPFLDGRIYKLNIFDGVLTSDQMRIFTTTFDSISTISPIYTKPIQVDLLVDYVYVSQPERDWFKKNELVYLTHSFQRLQFKIPTSTEETTYTYYTDFVNDVKELFWVIQSDAASNVYDYGNHLVNLQLTFNNQDFVTKDYATAQYLHVLQPLQYHTRVPTGNYYMYSFALQPESEQPTGEMNMSAITRQQHSLTLTASPSSTRNVRIYAHSYNLFSIKDGDGITVKPLREGGTTISG
jgi:hypothetical protein